MNVLMLIDIWPFLTFDPLNRRSYEEITVDNFCVFVKGKDVDSVNFAIWYSLIFDLFWPLTPEP